MPPVKITLPSNTSPDSLSPLRYLSIACLLRSYYLPVTKKYFSFALTFRKTIQSIFLRLFPLRFFPRLMHKSIPQKHSSFNSFGYFS
ncbi:hypothetical protein Barb7_01267 [Bacteroidales bacterium Barb7]|nr:hypothetical protein Barb7_01267 [Bacteroidales bacterium Barb7]